MHSDWLTKNVKQFADWSETKFLLVTICGYAESVITNFLGHI